MPARTKRTGANTSGRAPRATRSRHILEKSAGAVVFHRPRSSAREYLLIFSTYWEFPKGQIDPNESEHDAARREVREETGLAVELLPDFRHEINYFYRRRESKRLVKKQVIYFVAETRARDVRISHEHREAIWLPYDDALARLKYENARITLQRAHAFLEARA